MTDPNMYRAVVIRQAINFYRKTGQKVNRAYSPKAMMAAATKITGEPCGSLGLAEQKLTLWIEGQTHAQDPR